MTLSRPPRLRSVSVVIVFLILTIGLAELGKTVSRGENLSNAQRTNLVGASVDGVRVIAAWLVVALPAASEAERK